MKKNSDQKEWENFLNNPSDIIDKDKITKANQYKSSYYKFDFHGYSIEDANKKIEYLILQSIEKGVQELLIITGKGIHSNKKDDVYVSNKYNKLQNTIPDFIKNRPDNLKGVVNIDEFRKFVQENMIDNEDFNMDKYYLSDLFGDAEITLDGHNRPDGIIGSLGFKFGVRLCFIPPDTFSPPSPTVEQKAYSQYEKAYHLPSAGSPGTSHMFPLAIFEKDVLDEKLSEVLWDDKNFGRCFGTNSS